MVLLSLMFIPLRSIVTLSGISQLLPPHRLVDYPFLKRPMSTGAVLLKSNDPWQQPSVNPK